MKVKVKKLHPDAIIPQYQSEGAACFDLHALPNYGIEEPIFSGAPAVFKTGLAFEIPEGHVMLIFSRSGHGFKNDTRLANCVGVIDSDYRGEVKIKLSRDLSPEYPLVVNQGDRIAQAMIVPIPRIELVESEELSDTARGSNGYGSTGQ